VRLLALAILLIAAAAAPAAGQERRETPSGLPVPRWVVLKFDKVNARAGPGDDHRLLWVYRVKGLPVQVVQETADWRRVCDPDGGLAWVHKRVTDGRRNAMNLRVDNMPLRSAPQEDARPRAFWVKRSIGAFDECKGGWCRIKVGRISGWAPKAWTWGVQEHAVCGRRSAS
jgi:SH3-like domain-containing protein